MKARIAVCHHLESECEGQGQAGACGQRVETRPGKGRMVAPRGSWLGTRASQHPGQGLWLQVKEKGPGQGVRCGAVGSGSHWGALAPVGGAHSSPSDRFRACPQ